MVEIVLQTQRYLHITNREISVTQYHFFYVLLRKELENDKDGQNMYPD